MAELFGELRRSGSSAQDKSAIADMFHQARAIADCQLAKLDGDRYQRLYDSSEMLQPRLQQRIKRQARATGEFVRQLNMVEGDDTCELLLKDIWGSRSL
jgi:hypothetical protein